MSARGLASGLVQPIARGLVRSAQGGGGAPWGGLTNIVDMWPFDEVSGAEVGEAGNYNLAAFNSPVYEATGGPGGIPCRGSNGGSQYFRVSGLTDIASGDFTIVQWAYWGPVTQALDYSMIGNNYEVGIGQVNDTTGKSYVGADSPTGRNFASAVGTWRCTILRVQRSTKRLEVFVDGVSVVDVTMAADVAATTDMWFCTGDGLSHDSVKLARCAITRYRFTDADVAAFSASARDWAYWQAYSP